MTSFLQAFKTYLRDVGYREATCRMLPPCVQEFITHEQITDITCVEQAQVKNFYAWLHERPLKKRAGALSEMMIYHYTYALKTFFSWLEVTEQLDYNPISGLKFPRPKGAKRTPLTTPEIEELFRVATTLQQKAVLHLGYSCGLRRSEAEALNIADIRFREHRLYVRAGKGMKRRVIPLTRAVTQDLEAYYLQERCHPRLQQHADTEAFMLGRYGRRLSGNSYNRIVHQLADKAGVSPVSFHHLRHSIATHLLQNGMRLEQVREFLGHQYLEATQIYAEPDLTQLKLL